MKFSHALILLFAAVLPAMGQGPLAPSTSVDPKISGPIAPLSGTTPQPTMKTLHQVEPRTPLVNGAPGVSYNSLTGGFTINSPGSYYLTANLTVSSGNAITVNADGATVDLNGFNISTTANPALGAGISVTSFAAAVICNGTIHCPGTPSSTALSMSGAGFEYGVHINSNHSQVSRISIAGASVWGIFSTEASGNTVDYCMVRDSVRGISAGNISNCSASNISGTAISGQLITACFGTSSIGDGIVGTIVNGCDGRTLNTNVASTACGIRAPYTGGIVTNSRGSTGATGLSNSKSILAGTAVACSAVGETAIINRYNMPASP